MTREGKSFDTVYIKGKGMCINVYKDGDQWCCVHPHTFVNLQVSLAGFGHTPQKAIENFVEIMEEEKP